jgi:hypothetical protein
MPCQFHDRDRDDRNQSLECAIAANDGGRGQVLMAAVSYHT